MIKSQNIKSIAIPPLGAGNGGLDWNLVKPMITNALEGLNVDIQIYEPNLSIKEILQSQQTKRKVELTPARAKGNGTGGGKTV